MPPSGLAGEQKGAYVLDPDPLAERFHCFAGR